MSAMPHESHTLGWVDVQYRRTEDIGRSGRGGRGTSGFCVPGPVAPSFEGPPRRSHGSGEPCGSKGGAA